MAAVGKSHQQKVLCAEPQWSLRQCEGEKLIWPRYAAEEIYLAQSVYLHGIEMHHALKAPFPPVKGGEGPLRYI